MLLLYAPREVRRERTICGPEHEHLLCRHRHGICLSFATFRAFFFIFVAGTLIVSLARGYFYPSSQNKALLCVLVPRRRIHKLHWPMVARIASYRRYPYRYTWKCLHRNCRDKKMRRIEGEGEVKICRERNRVSQHFSGQQLLHLLSLLPQVHFDSHAEQKKKIFF